MTLTLLVDDEPLITDSLTYNLQREGFDFEAVADGLSAIEAAERENPDLIVIDLMLPDISGFEFLPPLSGACHDRELFSNGAFRSRSIPLWSFLRERLEGTRSRRRPLLA